MKLIGCVAVLGALTIGALIYFDQVEVAAQVTAKGHEQIQSLRNQAADQVRGK